MLLAAVGYCLLDGSWITSHYVDTFCVEGAAVRGCRFGMCWLRPRSGKSSLSLILGVGVGTIRARFWFR